ncbi:sulfotransferase [Stieleria sp. TO1_6]|uniref:sulfotransferase n=1 Tax=Stieleria tagensis TaxID=2956795 RepID=UPI00209A6FE8|nr:sulfotransferase [Stieleria tagensis]MCO8122499.1 sulfotransferase [Stieleria tagensis]
MFVDYFQDMKSEPKYVILGCQGSGTNLVSRLLQQTLEFSVVHDRSLIFNAAVGLMRDQESLGLQYAKIRKRIFPGKLRRRFMLKRHYRQAKHFQGLPSTIDSDLVKTPEDFANYLYAYHGYTTNAMHLGLKSDDLWESVEHIDVVIPNRRYLLLVRDPRDNAISITNKDFGPRNLYAASQYVQKRMSLYQAEVDRRTDIEAITIKYEDLLNEPQRQMETIAQEWRLNLCDDYIHRVEGLGIRKHNQSKWKKLSSEDLGVCESVLGEQIEKYDYPRSEQAKVELNKIHRIYYTASDVALRIPQRVYKTCRNFIRT